MRHASALFQRVKVPPRSGLLGPGSYPDAGFAERQPVKHQEKHGGFKSVGKHSGRNKSEDHRGSEIYDPIADPAASRGKANACDSIVCPDKK